MPMRKQDVPGSFLGTQSNQGWGEQQTGIQGTQTARHTPGDTVEESPAERDEKEEEADRKLQGQETKEEGQSMARGGQSEGAPSKEPGGRGQGQGDGRGRLKRQNQAGPQRCRLVGLN